MAQGYTRFHDLAAPTQVCNTMCRLIILKYCRAGFFHCIGKLCLVRWRFSYFTFPKVGFSWYKISQIMQFQFSVYVFAKVRTETFYSLRVERNWTLISFTVSLEKRFVLLTLKQPQRLTKRQRHWGRRKISGDNYQQFSARVMTSWWKLNTLARAKLCTCSEFCKFLYCSSLGQCRHKHFHWWGNQGSIK